MTIFFLSFFDTHESNALIHCEEHKSERPKPPEGKRTKETTKPNQKLRERAQPGLRGQF
jgi:hypothetical protein